MNETREITFKTKVTNIAVQRCTLRTCVIYDIVYFWKLERRIVTCSFFSRTLNDSYLRKYRPDGLSVKTVVTRFEQRVLHETYIQEPFTINVRTRCVRFVELVGSSGAEIWRTCGGHYNIIYTIVTKIKINTFERVVSKTNSRDSIGLLIYHEPYVPHQITHNNIPLYNT